MIRRRGLLKRIAAWGAMGALAFQFGTSAVHAKNHKRAMGARLTAHRIDPRKPIKLELELSQRQLLKFNREKAVYNPNQKGHCAGYARRIAEKYFNKKYRSADAWEFAKANRITFRRRFAGQSEASGISKGEMLFLIRKGIITPGTIIGARYPKSIEQLLHPEREFTHILIYAGDKIFWHVWDKDTPVKISVEKIYTSKIKDRVIYPLVVIEPAK